MECVESEQEDLDSSPASYDIVTYPADYTLESLVLKYKRAQILIPGFQRKFVWDLPKSSKLIESFLLNFPVPPVFLFVDPITKENSVIDGQQRLLSIVYFFEGVFRSGENGKNRKFALCGLNEQSPYFNKTYTDLEETDPIAYRNLNDAVLRAFVVHQLNPKDTTSALHVFERLKTGGTSLVSQEIRNCIYGGPFNDMLACLNREEDWRKVFGKENTDKRQRDIELVLRFLALREDSATYKKPMKDFLSAFMVHHRNDEREELDVFQCLFRQTMRAIRESLGDKPFHVRAGMNASVYDAVSTAFSKHLDAIPDDIVERYKTLVADEKFRRMVQSRTTDEEIVAGRLEHAEASLFS